MFVYILKSERDSKYYIGHTDDIKKRLQLHNCGNVKSTKYRRPLSVVYTEKVSNRSDAIKREKYIKSLKGGNAFKKLIKSELLN